MNFGLLPLAEQHSCTIQLKGEFAARFGGDSGYFVVRSALFRCEEVLRSAGERLDGVGFAFHLLVVNAFLRYLSSRIPQVLCEPSIGCSGFVPHTRGWGTDTSRRIGPQLVLFPVPHFRELGPESLKVSGLGLQVERQLDLSSMATRLRGGLVLFVRPMTYEAHPFFVHVKESKRVPVPLLVPVSTIVESPSPLAE
ncbi:hypothetical protein Taro_020953 [Colocasia esculenta]|uniref:Uncharacterized protein n=1 Tax=Colocasia esculenta TaxID=4460 RepID=A0A843V3X1_COLES|nr:hypothetical protein [Colocasia esculenta]